MELLLLLDLTILVVMVVVVLIGRLWERLLELRWMLHRRVGLCR